MSRFRDMLPGGQPLKTLSKQDYLKMREGAKVLEADPHGEKVLLLRDGSILKLFRRKRLLSSALFYPYAQRFAHNARRLSSIGVQVPTVIEVFSLPEMARDAVHYKPLPGETLRHLAKEDLAPERKLQLRTALNRLIVKLHCNGIYFRSLHLGNVIVTEDDQLGLIDFSDMRIYPWSLGKYLRQRNVQRMAKQPNEAGWLDMAEIMNGDRS